jgi:AP-3 complex subunit beta
MHCLRSSLAFASSLTPLSARPCMSGFNVNLDSITENASRLGARLQETFSEHTRDLAARGSSALFLDTSDDKLKDVRQQLDAGSDRVKLETLKRLIAVRVDYRTLHMYLN